MPAVPRVRDTQTICEKKGHLFVLIPDDISRRTENGGTGIYKTLFCSQCGDTKMIKTAQWEVKEKK